MNFKLLGVGDESSNWTTQDAIDLEMAKRQKLRRVYVDRGLFLLLKSGDISASEAIVSRRIGTVHESRTAQLLDAYELTDIRRVVFLAMQSRGKTWDSVLGWANRLFAPGTYEHENTPPTIQWLRRLGLLQIAPSMARCMCYEVRPGLSEQ